MSVSSNRTVRRAIEATMMERAKARAVEQAIAIGMIVAIGAMAMPMLGESGPVMARAGEEGASAEGTPRTDMGRAGPHDRYRPEGERNITQGLREGEGRTTR